MQANTRVQQEGLLRDCLKFLEAGQLYYRVCNFEKAFEVFSEGLRQAEAEQDWDAYIQYLPKLLRICIERLDDTGLSRLWQDFSKLRSQADFPSSSRVHYTMGTYFSHLQNSVQCHEHFKVALDISLAQERIEDEAYARLGLAGYYYAAGELELALAAVRQVQNLESKLPAGTDLILSSLIFEAVVLRSQRRFDEALMNLTEAQAMAKMEFNHHMVLNVLYNFGLTCRDQGSSKKAQNYFELALGLTNQKNLPRLYRAIQVALEPVTTTSNQEDDLVLVESSEPMLFIKGRGSLPLKNQFLLIKLLKLLASNPRRAHSKEEIVEALWQQSYHPLKDDNKLYVTIRRLRRLIEINEKAPHYVVKEQEGYLINPSVAFRIQGAN